MGTSSSRRARGRAQRRCAGQRRHTPPHAVHQWLLGSQVALSVALLAVAGLFVRTLQNLRWLDAGFDRKTVVLVTLNGGAATTAVARKAGAALEPRARQCQYVRRSM